MFVSEYRTGCWYMSFDYENLYQIVKDGDHYQVIRFGDWMPVFTGPLEACSLFMASTCTTIGYNERSVDYGK